MGVFGDPGQSGLVWSNNDGGDDDDELCYCRWVFLEILGSLALFGVMMIDASSRRMEMAMCHITVFSGQ